MIINTTAGILIIVGGILYFILGIIYTTFIINSSFPEIEEFFKEKPPNPPYSFSDITYCYTMFFGILLFWPVLLCIRMVVKFSLRKIIGKLIKFIDSTYLNS